MRFFSLAAAVVGCVGLCLAQPARQAAELKYVVIVTRHGVRAPTWTAQRLNEYSAEPWPDWGVKPGYLTVHGRALMTIMGGYYRDTLLAQGLLGKSGCADANQAYFWADTDQRTLETGRALAESVLPGCNVPVHSAPEGSADPLFDPVKAGIGKPDPPLAMAAVAGSVGPKLDAVVGAHRVAFDELVRVLNGNGKAARSIFDQPLSLNAGKDGASLSGALNLASTFTEDFLLEYANGMSGEQLGWGRLNASNLQQIMALHTTYADWMRQTPYLARVGGSNLLSHIVRSIAQAASGKPLAGALGPPRDALLVISGHDTNISNLAGMLGLRWLLDGYQANDSPPGGALVFSLWRSAETGRYSVRVQIVAQSLDQMHNATPLSLQHPPETADLFLPGCGTASEGYACDWEAFERTATAAIAPEFVKQ